MLRSSHRLHRARQRGASLVETLIVIGLVSLGSIGAVKAYGATTTESANAEAEHVRNFTGIKGGAGGPACTTGDCGIVGSTCFAAGTLVAWTAGPQPIEAIVAGDEVLSEDETTGEVSVRKATATFVTEDADVLDLFVDGEPDPVRTTPGHRFFTLDRGWRHSEDLEPGEPLVDDDGRAIRVDHLEREAERTRVYNFEVDVTHTYFVGPRRILVHNPVEPTGVHHTNVDGSLGPEYHVFNPPGGTTCVVNMTAGAATDSGFEGAYDATYYRYSDLKSGSLANCKHLVIEGHGSPGRMANPKTILGATVNSIKTPADIADKLRKSGFVGGPGSEILAATCNAGTCRTPSTSKYGPSVVDGLAEAFPGTKVYGPKSNNPDLATEGKAGPGGAGVEMIMRKHDGVTLVSVPSGVLAVIPNSAPRPETPPPPAMASFGFYGMSYTEPPPPSAPPPPSLVAPDSMFVEVVHSPVGTTTRPCQAIH